MSPFEECPHGLKPRIVAIQMARLKLVPFPNPFSTQMSRSAPLLTNFDLTPSTPAPMFSIICPGELAGFDFGGAGHQALEVVGDFLLLDGALHALFDQVGGFVPAEVAEHHDAGEDHRAGIDDVFVGVLRRGAVRGFEDGVAVADVRARERFPARPPAPRRRRRCSRRSGWGVARTEYSSARVTTCWKMESAMRSLIMSFFFHAPLPWVA